MYKRRTLGRGEGRHRLHLWLDLECFPLFGSEAASSVSKQSCSFPHWGLRTRTKKVHGSDPLPPDKEGAARRPGRATFTQLALSSPYPSIFCPPVRQDQTWFWHDLLQEADFHWPTSCPRRSTTTTDTLFANPPVNHDLGGPGGVTPALRRQLSPAWPSTGGNSRCTD
jgi:hypothetical protein